MTLHRLFRSAFALALGSCTFAAGAATFTVTRADDPAPDGCLAADCSLREAIEATAATPEADTVVLGAGQYQVTLGEISIDRAITIRGAGSAATRITSSGDYTILHAVGFGDLVVEGVEIGTVDGIPVAVADGGLATLRDVHVPSSSGGVGTDAPSGNTGSGSMRLEHSTIDSVLACLQPDGSCRVFDSRMHQVLVSGSEFELVRSEIDGANSDFYGLSIASLRAVTIEDSTIRRTLRPLWLIGNDETAERVNIRRTRFIDNTGPLNGDRQSIVDMDEVEFRHHVVSDADAGAPAVLMAVPGPTWFISRALVVGNRGGGSLDGAVVRVLGGGRVVFDNSTFDDNTFRAGASFGHTIGVYNDSGAPTVLWLLHVTMRRAPTLEDDTVGSLLTVRGPSTDVRVMNSALRGTCGFGGGGAIVQAVGNAESIGDTCGLDPATNQIDVESFDMSLGDLADHGGFTATFQPTRNSILLDAADAGLCTLVGTLDQRRFVRPADGVGCDIGALEVGAVADTIFADALGG
jgi:hypothetical protein